MSCAGRLRNLQHITTQWEVAGGREDSREAQGQAGERLCCATQAFPGAHVLLIRCIPLNGQHPRLHIQAHGHARSAGRGARLALSWQIALSAVA